MTGGQIEPTVATVPIRMVRRRRKARSARLDGIAVNGVEIPPQAIAEEAQQHPAADGEAAWAAAARALAIRELLLQEAARLGVVGEPETDEAGRRELDEEATIRALLEREAAPFVPSEAECRRYYDANPGRFRTPELFEAAHILIEPASPAEADWAAAEHEARTIAEQVGDAREDFAEAARAFSRCPTAHQGGALGQVRRGELLPTVQAAIESLPEQTTGRQPVRSAFGWHVLRLDRRIEGRVLPYETVRPRIVDLLEARAWATASQRFIDALVRAADIEGIDLEPGAAR